jgi:hypothetical protein
VASVANVSAQTENAGSIAYIHPRVRCLAAIHNTAEVAAKRRSMRRKPS